MPSIAGTGNRLDAHLTLLASDTAGAQRRPILDISIACAHAAHILAGIVAHGVAVVSPN